MMRISKAALAAMMIAGTGGLVMTQPVLAAKDKKQEEPQLKLSDTVRNAAVAAQTALAAKDFATAETQISAVNAAAKNDDERYIGQSLALSLAAQRSAAAGAGDAATTARNDQALVAPLDALLANPSTPPSELPRFTYLRGTVAFNAGKYDDATKYLQKAQQLGYQNEDLPLQLVKSRVESGDVAGGIDQLGTLAQQEKTAGRQVPETWYRYGIAKLYRTNDHAKTLDWVQQWLTAYPTSKNWRDAIIVFGFQGPTAARMGKPEKVDLYRLMDVTGALADQGDYLEYAQLAYDLGLPNETKTVIAKGKGNGKIPGGNGDAATLAKQAQNAISNEGSLSSLAAKAKSSSDGKLAAQTGDAYLGAADYANAIPLYRTALEKGGVNADEVNTHLGIALAMSGDKGAAATAFSNVSSAPRTEIASLWRTWIAQTTAGAAPAAATAG